ncbi:MAG: hypothetical protein ABSE85_07935 [Candidatus Korobacteraceae bacterium]|jgi:hypothetical protein
MPDGESAMMRYAPLVIGGAALFFTAVSAGIEIVNAEEQHARTMKIVLMVAVGALLLFLIGLAIYLNVKDARRARKLEAQHAEEIKTLKASHLLEAEDANRQLNALRGELDAVKRQSLSPRDEVDPKERELFKAFFGEGALDTQGYKVVFLSAETPPWPVGVNRIANQLKLCNPPEESAPESPEGRVQTLPKGIFHIIPFEDLDGVLKIDREFAKYGGKLKMEYDNYREDITADLPEKGCLSVGLGYNNVTTRLMKLSDYLFEVTYKDNDSDDFRLRRHYYKDRPSGPHDYETITARKNEEYALIARVLVPKGGAEKPVPYIVCAGHTAKATVVACKYLATDWRTIAEKFQEKGNLPDCVHEYNMGVVLRYTMGAKEAPRLDEPQFEDRKIIVAPRLASSS